MCACSYETRLLLPQVESRRRRCVARVSEREDLRTMANTDQGKVDLYDTMNRLLKSYLNTFDKTAAIECRDGLAALFKETKPAEMKDLFIREDRREDNVFLQVLTQFKFEALTEIETEIIQLLLKTLPGDVLSTPRSTGEYCCGQNALHCVIGRHQIKLLKAILDCPNLKAQRRCMMSQKPNQTKLQGTVMMGELPLSVAALTFSKEMVTMLLRKGAELEGQNSCGDAVVHSLIRYAAKYPDKTKQVLQMFDLISRESRKAPNSTRASVWLLVNHDKLNPLQLATKLGQQELFSYIIDLEHYKFIDLQEGIFDIFSYDISEIDTVPPRIESSTATIEPEIKVTQNNPTQSVPVLHILMKLESVVAERFVSIKPISYVIKLKWKQWKKWVIVCAFFHFAFMVGLTYYTLERAQVKLPSNSSLEFVNRLYENNPFVSAYGTLSFVVGCFYMFLVPKIFFYSVYIGMWWCRNINFYLAEIFIFAIALVVDYIWAVSKQNLEFNYVLVIAVILGWLLLLFFMRTLFHLSFFTTLLENVFFDLLQFSVIMIPILIAFTAAMYFAMQGSSYTEDDTFLYFFQTLFFMLSVMVGLGDFDVLFTARHPVFVFIVFVTFVLMTTILLLNALIALMANTCNDVIGGGTQKRKSMCRIQKLYTVLFIELMLFGKLKRSVRTECEQKRRYCPNLKVVKSMPRSLLKVFKIVNDAKPAYVDPDTTNSRKKERRQNKKSSLLFDMNTVDIANLSRTFPTLKRSSERTTVDPATDRD